MVMFVTTSIINTVVAQDRKIPSGVYQWNELPVEKKATGERRQIDEGSTSLLSYLEIHSTTVGAGLAPHKPHSHDDEELILVKEGTLNITINGKSKIVGPGGIALMLSGEEHGMVNVGKTPATYYVMRYRGNSPLNHDQGVKAGGSIMLDYKDLKKNNHDKGYRIDYFNRPTSAVESFEMHITSLKKGNVSHAAHTHVAEEIILIIKGDTEMEIDGKFYKAPQGSLVFLASNDPHALKNLTDGDCEYFAFQWR